MSKQKVKLVSSSGQRIWWEGERVIKNNYATVNNQKFYVTYVRGTWVGGKAYWTVSPFPTLKPLR